MLRISRRTRSMVDRRRRIRGEDTDRRPSIMAREDTDNIRVVGTEGSLKDMDSMEVIIVRLDRKDKGRDRTVAVTMEGMIISRAVVGDSILEVDIDR